MATTNFYEAILNAVKGVSTTESVGAVDNSSGTPDVSPSPGGTSTVENWRSRGIVGSSVVAEPIRQRYWRVPPGREWQLLGISATIQTTAVAGNRRHEVFVNPGNPSLTVFHHRFPAAPQAASLTYNYNFAVGNPLLTAAANNFLSAPLPPFILPPTSAISMWDRAQVDQLNDVWSDIYLLVLERVIA